MGAETAGGAGMTSHSPSPPRKRGGPDIGWRRGLPKMVRLHLKCNTLSHKTSAGIFRFLVDILAKCVTLETCQAVQLAAKLLCHNINRPRGFD